MVFTDDQGREQRALLPSDKFCPNPDFSLPKLFRGILTNRWDNADREKRAASGTVDTSGGVSLGGPVVSAMFFDLARNKMRTIVAGAQSLPMPSRDVSFVRQTGDITASWRAENSNLTASDSTFGAVTLHAHNLAAVTSVTNELMQDSPPNFGDIVTNALAQAMALEWDRVAFAGIGTGGGEPGPGILTDSEVTTTDNGGSAITPDNLSTMVQTIREANYTPNAMLLPSAIWGQLDRKKDGNGQYLGKDNFPPSVRDLLWLDTNQLTDEVIIGQFDQLIIGVRQELMIETFKAGSVGGVDALERNLTWIRATLRGDLAVMRGAAFEAYDNNSTA